MGMMLQQKALPEAAVPTLLPKPVKIPPEHLPILCHALVERKTPGAEGLLCRRIPGSTSSSTSGRHLSKCSSLVMKVPSETHEETIVGYASRMDSTQAHTIYL